MENNKIELVKNFAPSWFTVIMGTGIIPIALSLNKNIVPLFNEVSKVFFFLTLSLFVIILIPWITRFIQCFENIKKDFCHPILGSFFPTFGIAVMILATNFVVIGKSIFGEKTALLIATILYITGSASIVLLSLIIFPIIFINNKIELGHGNFGWFIPGVSFMFIPLLGLDLIGYYKSSAASLGIFVASMAGFGIGIILFIYIGTAVYHRYLYHEILMPKLAPTLFIGLVPPALITIICVKLTSAVNYISFLTSSKEIIVTLSGLIGIITWGFALWWYIIASIVIINYIKNKKLPYALSWWAFTFPTGALAVSTGTMNKLLKLAFFDYSLTAIIIVMITIWMTVAFRTFKAVLDKSVFQG